MYGGYSEDLTCRIVKCPKIKQYVWSVPNYSTIYCMRSYFLMEKFQVSCQKILKTVVLKMNSVRYSIQ